MPTKTSTRSNCVKAAESTRTLSFQALFVATTVLTIAAAGAVPVRAAPVTERVSVKSDETQSNGLSIFSYLSNNGRYVLFDSQATNLVSGDTNARRDVFLRDRTLGTTTLVSTSSAGVQGTSDSFAKAISSDGRYVLFNSQSSNLVANDTNGLTDVFLKDRQTGTTTRVNLSSAGVVANKASNGVALSADGRYVLFNSAAANLVANDTNGLTDGFLRDLQTGTTQRVTLGNGGVQGNSASSPSALSPDARYVVFYSDSTNLVAGDTNGIIDVFVRDRQLSTTERVSVTSAEAQLNAQAFGGALSANGRFVLFSTEATNVVSGDAAGTLDLFLRDRVAGTTQAVSVKPDGTLGGAGGDASISSDGRYIAFSSSGKLSTDDTNSFADAFVRDRRTGVTTRVSKAFAGAAANGFSGNASISRDGKVVAFTSSATNLVIGDTNSQLDVFARAPLF